MPIELEDFINPLPHFLKKGNIYFGNLVQDVREYLDIECLYLVMQRFISFSFTYRLIMKQRETHVKPTYNRQEEEQ